MSGQVNTYIVEVTVGENYTKVDFGDLPQKACAVLSNQAESRMVNDMLRVADMNKEVTRLLSMCVLGSAGALLLAVILKIGS